MLVVAQTAIMMKHPTCCSTLSYRRTKFALFVDGLEEKKKTKEMRCKTKKIVRD